jgi:16S rRNA (cytidine1402-2'-O)-methyltransferase
MIMENTNVEIHLVPYFTQLMSGINVGLMSEAGCPGVADPGAEIVAEAHKRGIKSCSVGWT